MLEAMPYNNTDANNPAAGNRVISIASVQDNAGGNDYANSDVVLVRDYDSVRRAIAFMSKHWRAQPAIEAVAEAASLTPDELHLLFRRWAGLTPKAFMQALTLDHAKSLLRDSASVLDAALDSGLSGPGRLHDLFVTHEAMSPGEWKAGGEGIARSSCIDHITWLCIYVYWWLTTSLSYGTGCALFDDHYRGLT